MERPQLAPGEEWVWDYPRSPRLERSARVIRVIFAGAEIARTDRAWRADVRAEALRSAVG